MLLSSSSSPARYNQAADGFDDSYDPHAEFLLVAPSTDITSSAGKSTYQQVALVLDASMLD